VIPSRAPNTASRLIAGEAVILSLDTKILRGLNEVGSRVWDLIDGRRTLDDIVDVIVAEFEVPRTQAAADVDVFVRELVDKGLAAPA
jgi:coenzyme PQQ synthesis protein D (PqqD)